MPYQNDMSTLAQVVGPAEAAYQGMTQDTLSNQKQQLENERYAGQNPAEIAKPGLQNLFQEQQTATQQGLAQTAQAKGTEAQTLLPGEIAVGGAKQKTEYGAQQLQQFQQLGTMAGHVAGMMDRVPEDDRPAAMQQLAQQYNIPLQSLGPLADGNPDNLRSFRDKIIQGSQDYQTKYMQEAMHNEGASNVATITGQSGVEKANVTAQARIQVQTLVTQMKQQQQTAEQAAIRLAQTNPALAHQFASFALQMKQAQAGITSQLITGHDLAVPDFGAGGGGQQPQAPSAPNSTPAMVAQAKAVWPNDDPSKYDYRMGPDGNIQRKAK